MHGALGLIYIMICSTGICHSFLCTQGYNKGSGALPEKLLVPQLVKKFPLFH
jgi:hypothetical protein